MIDADAFDQPLVEEFPHLLVVAGIAGFRWSGGKFCFDEHSRFVALDDHIANLLRRIVNISGRQIDSVEGRNGVSLEEPADIVFKNVSSKPEIFVLLLVGFQVPQ